MVFYLGKWIKYLGLKYVLSQQYLHSEATILEVLGGLATNCD